MFRILLHWTVAWVSRARLGFSFIGLFTYSSHADRSLETIVWFCSAFSSPTKAEHCILLFHLNRHSSNGQRYNSSNFTSEHRLTACNCFNEIEAGENLKSEIYNKWLTYGFVKSRRFLYKFQFQNNQYVFNSPWNSSSIYVKALNKKTW